MTLRGAHADPPAPEPDAGVVVPLVDGERSTQKVGRDVVSRATARVDTAASEAARDEQRWYRHYIEHFVELTRLSAGPNAGLVAGDGLTALHDVMRFRRQGSEIPLSEAITAPMADYFTGVTVEGSAPAEDAGLVLYDQDLPCRGSQLEALLDRWDEKGIGEPSATDALRLLRANPDWLNLQDVTVVALGAGAELSPVPALLRWGCHVVAVDLPGRHRWRTLIDLARHSSGRLTIPVRDVRVGAAAAASDALLADAAGADVTTEAPELVEWLAGMDGGFVVGDYTYAPGADHLRTSTAVDGVVTAVMQRRPDVGVAYLATPTDCYAVPSETVDASVREFAESGPLVAMARGIAGRRMFRPNYENSTHVLATGRRFGLFDGLISQQGANYALAKRIQRWRAHSAREDGRRASINVAPATRTASVVSNRMLEAAYGGSHRFGLHVFTPQATRQVMAALLVHDLRNDRSVAHPDVPLHDALDLTAAEALHGGMWRAPYSPRSVLGFAAAAGRFRR